MKKLIATIATTALILTGCNFLERTPYDTVDTTVEVTDAVAQAMANACYRTLQSSNMYNQRLWTLDIVAGNSNVGAGGGTKPLISPLWPTMVWRSICGVRLGSA